MLEHKNSDLSIIRRWGLLRSSYPLLFKLVQALLAIPYSTAKVESVFSECKSFKTAPRNQISSENLEASLISEQYYRTENPNLTKDMIARHAHLWEKKEPPISTKKKEEEKEGETYILRIEKVRKYFKKCERSYRVRNKFKLYENLIKCETTYRLRR